MKSNVTGIRAPKFAWEKTKQRYRSSFDCRASTIYSVYRSSLHQGSETRIMSPRSRYPSPFILLMFVCVITLVYGEDIPDCCRQEYEALMRRLRAKPGPTSLTSLPTTSSRTVHHQPEQTSAHTGNVNTGTFRLFQY